MIRELLENFSTFARILLVLCSLFIIWRYKLLPEEHKRLAPFVFISLLVEIIADYLSVHWIPNLFLLHLYTLVELFCWLYFYHWIFRNSKKIRSLIHRMALFVPVLIILNTIFFEPVTAFNSNAKSLVSILLLFLAFLYFFNAFGKIDLSQRLPKSISLINFGVLIYYSSSLFIFMFSKLLNNKDVTYPHQMVLWTINSIVYVIFLTLLLISLWTAFSKTKSY